MLPHETERLNDQLKGTITGVIHVYPDSMMRENNKMMMMEDVFFINRNRWMENNGFVMNYELCYEFNFLQTIHSFPSTNCW